MGKQLYFDRQKGKYTEYLQNILEDIRKNGINILADMQSSPNKEKGK